MSQGQHYSTKVGTVAPGCDCSECPARTFERRTSRPLNLQDADTPVPVPDLPGDGDGPGRGTPGGPVSDQSRSVLLLPLRRTCKFESHGFDGREAKAARARRILQCPARPHTFRARFSCQTRRCNAIPKYSRLRFKLTIPPEGASCRQVVALMVLDFRPSSNLT